jgi:sugar phosphate isomerase/epimerase
MTLTERPDAGRLIGMSLAAGLELEPGAAHLADLGFEAMEVYYRQIGPRIIQVRTGEVHAAAAGDVIRAAGLAVSTLNVTGNPMFQPFGDSDERRATVDDLAGHLRWAAAMGSPRVLIWDGIVEDPADAPNATPLLVDCIARAFERSGLNEPPEVSIELHPFTYALEQGRLEELAAALHELPRAGICLDFCHFAVALGKDFVNRLDGAVLDAVNHIHYSDSDCATSELHFPPGAGVLDLDAIGDRLANRGLAAAWDLFSWPGPDRAMRELSGAYRAFVNRL